MKNPGKAFIRRYRIKLSLIQLDNQSFHIIAKGMINNLPVNLIIDTGASRSVFNREYLEQHLSPIADSGEKVHSAGISAEKIEVVTARADTFVLGKYILTDYPLMLINLNKINKLYRKVAGITIHGLLGSDFLKEMNANIDFGKSIMVLKPGSI